MSAGGVAFWGRDGRLPGETFQVAAAENGDWLVQKNGSYEAWIGVGDTVGVEVEDGSWAAAEVTNLWWEGSEARCEVRWFYTVAEVPRQCRPPEAKGFVETDVMDEIPFEAVMGKIDVEADYLYKVGQRTLIAVDARLRRKRCEALSKKHVHQQQQPDEGATLLDACVAALQLRRAPRQLKRRERERAQIEAFVRESVKAGSGRIYISGMPGTGKTATVREVAQRCEDLDFDFVEINAMRLPRPAHAYTLLWQAVSGEVVAAEAAARALEKTYSRSCGAERMVVALVDELDWLVTKDQSVLYNLFDWPTRNARLAVIGVANTMDLPERLDAKVRSRLGCRRACFQPYTREDVLAILEDRLRGDLITCFEPKALDMAARKVSAYSGDVRRALQICATAAEYATDVVTIADINKAYKLLSDSPALNAVKHASDMERFILLALCVQLKRNSDDEHLAFSSLKDKLVAIVSHHAADKLVPPHTHLLAILNRFSDARLITLTFLHPNHRFPHISLNTHPDILAENLVSTGDPLARTLLGGPANLRGGGGGGGGVFR
ncbi:hypothetical protein CTAYLR_004018 [Chrysophaeum taylorii]|uniref:Origin recognition complex subunit 1 n=1 Tax=Chrysophaeum taylorii TaxID=2483200 RepID=A0AAD7U8M9_9STRA|nr:hypothetical protein CTAYLR_004018 [Chrysophaeum taylorii]